MSSNHPDSLDEPAPLPDDLERALASARLRFGRLGGRTMYFPVIGSTNDAALALAAGNESEGTIVMADEQHAGRGRRGHEWFSPPGSGLYVSVVVMPGRSRDDPVRATTILTLMAGVALAEGIEAATGLAVQVKWPNDLYIARRKLGGILAEAAGGSGLPKAIVVGYGINVKPAAYPPDLRDRATSLETELGRPVDRARVLVESIAGMARRYDDLLAGRFDAILDAWRGRAPASVGAHVTWASGSGRESGVTAGIDASGALLVRLGGRIERIVAGEVNWL